MSVSSSPSHRANQERARSSARLVLRGVAINALLAAAKFAAGIFGHTYALIADGAESLLDIFSSLLVWAGRSGERADEQRKFHAWLALLLNSIIF